MDALDAEMEFVETKFEGCSENESGVIHAEARHREKSSVNAHRKFTLMRPHDQSYSNSINLPSSRTSISTFLPSGIFTSAS